MRVKSLRLQFLLVTVARENGKPGIFRETRIGVGEFAEIEDGAVGRFNAARMQASGAKARNRGTCLFFGRLWHSGRIAQVKGQVPCQWVNAASLPKPGNGRSHKSGML